MKQALEDATRILSGNPIEAAELNGMILSVCTALVAQEARARKLMAAAERLANAADDVGVRYFDTDTMDEHVERMRDATDSVRAALAEGRGK